MAAGVIPLILYLNDSLKPAWDIHYAIGYFSLICDRGSRAPPPRIVLELGDGYALFGRNTFIVSDFFTLLL